MKKNLLLLLLFIVTTLNFVIAQAYDPLNPPNTFNSPDNPLYWKNRKPFPGYWQQDVHYMINAYIDERTDIISADMVLEYWNNSPDNLEYVYFHLYQNAFLPHSYHDDLSKNNKVIPKYGRYESQGLGTKIEKIKYNNLPVETELENTILKVKLPYPIKSGESCRFEIKFKTFFDAGGNVRRRMKMFYPYGWKHYDGVHWYPRISVYDRKMGWDTDQHLGREFYGDYGTFDVELNFNASFIVDATGNLVNKDEVMPADLRAKLDIKNFKDKPLYEKPSVIIPYDSTQRKTWKFHAENVHDFAFTADPTYRIGEAEWNGIKCIALAQEPHAARWQNAADYTAKIIEVYSTDFGMYEYPKMIVADARDGMEYPMLTLDGGFDPDYRSLFAHEIAHNWFFGMVGSNETYRAALDEGFTQFLNAWALEKIDGPEMVVSKPKSKYVRKFTKPKIARERTVFYGYLQDAVIGEDAFLNTHSDGFNGALRHGGGYRHVYYKTAAMLYNLQFVLGDSLFLAAMQHYFHQWKFAHPYMEDFRSSIIQFTKVDLNWFFDQWLETTKSIDYGIKSIRKGKEKDEYIITFKRKGRMQMPLDFEVEAKNDSIYKYHIPNGWFVKQTDATVLPRWIGWDKLKPTYEANVKIPSGIYDVRIDPTQRLADIYPMDNAKRTPIHVSLDHRIYNQPDRNAYEIFGRPELWYNGFDGIKTGFHINGNYMQEKHIFDLTAWFNSGIGQNITLPPSYLIVNNPINQFDRASVRFNYRTNIHKVLPQTYFKFSATALDGLYAGNIGFEKFAREEKERFYIFYKSMIRPDTSDLNYLLLRDQWQYGRLNNTLNLGWDHYYNYTRGYGHINIHMRSSALGSYYDFATLSITAINKNVILKKLEFNSRVFAQYGTGNFVPLESSLFLAGANPEEMMDNKYVRSVGFIPEIWTRYGPVTNNFQHGGGLNLRGYAGYLAPYEDKEGNMHYTYRGLSGAAINLELDFDRFFSFIRPKYIRDYIGIDTYLFADAGIINYQQNAFANLRADAGVGTALTIKKWGPLQMVKPLTIRFDMPLFLNTTPALEPDFIQMRWVVGINRAF
jgi:aminopeptidase N